MTWSPTATSILIGCLFVVMAAFDVVVYCLGGNDWTLSKAMQRLGQGWPIIIVAYGGLGAHFFCPRESHFCGCWTELKPYVLLALGVFVFRLAWTQALN
jgi:hypothetical protein